MLEQQAKYNELFKAKHTIAAPLDIGTFVMRRDQAPDSKEAAPFVGPYEIIGYNDARRTYNLRDEAGGVLPHDVPREHLKPIRRAQRPAGQEHDGDIYYVERIVDDKKVRGAQKYLIKWVGFDELTWEPASNIQDASLIRDYWATKRRLPS